MKKSRFTESQIVAILKEAGARMKMANAAVPCVVDEDNEPHWVLRVPDLQRV